jgi:hypothetical protein
MFPARGGALVAIGEAVRPGKMASVGMRAGAVGVGKVPHIDEFPAQPVSRLAITIPVKKYFRVDIGWDDYTSLGRSAIPRCVATFVCYAAVNHPGTHIPTATIYDHLIFFRVIPQNLLNPFEHIVIQFFNGLC